MKLETDRYAIQGRHVSGSSNWDVQPECGDFSTEAEAEAAMDDLEDTDEDGAPLEYRVVRL